MKTSKKLIVRIKGGLGNQLFCYAVARRLAIANAAELVIDDQTGFVRDTQYNRKYMLGCFKLPVRLAKPWERLAPFERWRRGFLKLIERRKPFMERKYLEEAGLNFDQRILDFKFKRYLYLDGLWFSEAYFVDIESQLRQDLAMDAPQDTLNQKVFAEIRRKKAVALHVRWFDVPGLASSHNASVDYYSRAIDYMEQKLGDPHYFLFSDNPEAAKSKLNLPQGRVSFIDHNRADDQAWADLWLMSNCQHFITANSTFSWWAAWLSPSPTKIVLTPDLVLEGKTAWGFDGLIPDSWIKL